MADGGQTLHGLYALRAPEPAASHVAEDDWLALASGSAPASLREQAVGHVVRCASCARVYRGLSDLEDGARRFDRGVPRSLGPAPLNALQTTRWAWWGGLAAAATLVWAIAQPRPALAPNTPPAEQGLRSAGDARPALVAPLGAVTAWPSRLRWQPVAATRAYRVRILDAAGDELWTSPLVGETSLAWPVDVAPRPGRVYWQVTAYPQDRGDADAVASVLASFDYQP